MKHRGIAYHSAEIVSNSSKVEWHHSEEIKKLPESVNISTKNLFTITTSNFPFKQGNLIEPDISSLTNLYKSQSESFDPNTF